MTQIAGAGQGSLQGSSFKPGIRLASDWYLAIRMGPEWHAPVDNGDGRLSRPARS